MEIFIVTMVTETEYCGTENIGVFSTYEQAEQYIAELGQCTFEHWNGAIIDVYGIETWEVNT